MSDSNRSGYGSDDPTRGPLDRAANAVDSHDDPNRGPLDRAANAITGGTGRVSAALSNDDPNRGPLDRAENAVDLHDDPNRGPLDRAANATTGGSGGMAAAFGNDDPNRGPLDRAANAITGGTGGVSAALGNDDPNRGPFDRATNAVTGGTGGVAGAGYASANGSQSTVSALFDTQAEAERAVSELRSAGVSDSALSVIAQSQGTTTTRSADGEITDEQHESVARGILGGGALGAGLGVLALAIPGVGPLVAAGAIAASAVPAAMAFGAAAGVAAGTFNESLKNHGIDDDDAAYYSDRMANGGVLVTVSGGMDTANVSGILRRNGGHSASSPRTATV